MRSNTQDMERRDDQYSLQDSVQAAAGEGWPVSGGSEASVSRTESMQWVAPQDLSAWSAAQTTPHPAAASAIEGAALTAASPPEDSRDR
jgi:hypothetical protein